MAKTWEHGGYEIDEGLKPRDGNFKPDHYQYFFMVKKDDRRVMKFCIWASRPYVEEIVGEDIDPIEYLREQAMPVIIERIDSGIFENTLLELSAAGQRLVPLDDIPGKKI